MWGAKAHVSKHPYKSGMKWHIVDETSIEYRDVKYGWGEYGGTVSLPYGLIDCGGSGYGSAIPLILKDSLNLNGSGVCAYCRSRRLKELGMLQKVMG